MDHQSMLSLKNATDGCHYEMPLMVSDYEKTTLYSKVTNVPCIHESEFYVTARSFLIAACYLCIRLLRSLITLFTTIERILPFARKRSS